MKKALVVEGGAMRGIFAAGVLDGFISHNHFDYDFALGVSAGATNLSTYVTKAKGLSRTIILQYATRREFYSPVRFIRGGHMTDVHWLWHHSKQNLPMPSPGPCSTMPLYVGITNTVTGQAEYPKVTAGNIDDLMVASCAIPTAYREQPRIDGTAYVDGGVADPIPVRQAYAMGARDITIVLSQPLGYTKPTMKLHWLMDKLYGDQPALLKTMEARAVIYNDTLDFINHPPADCTINVIAPSKAFKVKRLTMDKRKLHAGYRQGLAAALRYLRRRPQKAA